jgi:hypothetical protein
MLSPRTLPHFIFEWHLFDLASRLARALYLSPGLEAQPALNRSESLPSFGSV